jgi:hypothetical protein
LATPRKDILLDFFFRFWYSAIACYSRSSFSALSGSLGRVMVMVKRDFGDLIAD